MATPWMSTRATNGDRGTPRSLGTQQDIRHEILPSGPLYRSVIFKDSTAYVTFDYGKGMHSSDGDKLRTFEIAEHDGLFVPAEAQIIDGKTVKVWSGQIRNPKFVRYGWQPFTRANLVNEAGLPASTFRSEAAPVSWFRAARPTRH